MFVVFIKYGLKIPEILTSKRRTLYSRTKLNEYICTYLDKMAKKELKLICLQ